MKCLIELETFFFIMCFILGCANTAPMAVGEAADELTYLVIGDTLELDDGSEVYVEDDGMLYGVSEPPLLAVGRKVRDVMLEAREHHTFEKYYFRSYGERYVDVAGAVPEGGRYSYPIQEDWTIMNLLMHVGAIDTASETREYLLVRKAWQIPGSFVFLRGELLPEWGGIGGDDLMIHSGDLVLFPGSKMPIYVFGNVHKSTCFTFASDTPTVLATAIENAGGIQNGKTIKMVHIYRIIKDKQPTVFTLAWPNEKDFVLNPWDIIYVP